MPQDRVIQFPLYTLVLPYFPRVPTRLEGQVTFNMKRQWYEFVDSSGTESDLSYVIYHKKHYKCYFFADTSEWRLAPLSTFSIDTKFVICKGRHLDIPKPNVEISDEVSSNSEMSILVTTQNNERCWWKGG